MRHNSFSRILLGAGAFALLGGVSLAFVLLSPPRKWHASQLPRNFRIGMLTGENSMTKPDTQLACTNAVDVWTAAVGPGYFTRTVDNGLGNIGFVNDGLSTITFEDPQNLLSAGVLGAATVGFYTTSATEVVNGTTFFKYTDSDVVLNNGVLFTSFKEADDLGANGNQYDMEGIVVQEVGHSIGLDHPSIEQASMYGTLSSNDWRKRNLDDDDINGARFVYVNGYTPENFLPGSDLVADSTFLGLSNSSFNGASKIYIRITVVDENGNTVTGATVYVTVAPPNGSPLSGSGTVSSTGRITFNAGKAKHGTYSATVTNIQKSGMTFNAGAGKSSDTATF
jgi:hypothetical protein